MKKDVDKSEQLRSWLDARPALSVNMIEQEAGLPFTTLAKVVSPALQKKLPYKHWEALEIVLKKYGWR